uniref:Uncharacterized protein n=1 Tax=Ovis aries TaxID=9940 RepID=A0AC11DHZ6_SHEEP
MAFSNLSACSSDLSYSSRICLPGSCDSCTGSSWQVDDCPESCCEPPCCAPSCCTSAPRLTLLCAPVSSPGAPLLAPGPPLSQSWTRSCCPERIRTWQASQKALDRVDCGAPGASSAGQAA